MIFISGGPCVPWLTIVSADSLNRWNECSLLLGLMFFTCGVKNFAPQDGSETFGLLQVRPMTRSLERDEPLAARCVQRVEIALGYGIPDDGIVPASDEANGHIDPWQLAEQINLVEYLRPEQSSTQPHTQWNPHDIQPRIRWRGQSQPQKERPARRPVGGSIEPVNQGFQFFGVG
jgi:hypothetical protein